MQDFFKKSGPKVSVEEFNQNQVDIVPDIEEVGATGTKRPPMPSFQ